MGVTAIEAPRAVRVGTHRYPVVPPSIRDPRLQVAAVIATLHVLGQTSLGFEVSILQIVIAMATCALLELAITFWRRRAIVWPGSALLTGSGIALILRVVDTNHGDWWSLRGAYIFAAVAAGSLLTKYVIRMDGRPLFNPSNIGLLVCFLVLGTGVVNPLDFWWHRLSPAMVFAYIVITVGGLTLAMRLGLLPVVVSFWLTFAASLAVVVLGGHAMTARWHVGPLAGRPLWWTLVTSPEILVFLFFMITDPKTAPQGRRARVVYGVTVGFVAALLLAPARSEFMSKVAVLGALTFTCALRPLFERRFRAEARAPLGPSHRAGRAVIAGVRLALLVGLLLIATMPARGGTKLSAQPAAPSGPAPNVDISRISIEIDPQVRTVDAQISAGRAHRMVADLVNDLAIEADALRVRDVELAATAVHGSRLERAREAIQAADHAAAPSNYRLDSATVVIVRTGRQSSPSIGLWARGVEIHRPGQGAGQEVPYDHRFVLIATPQRYLIDDAF